MTDTPVLADCTQLSLRLRNALLNADLRTRADVAALTDNELRRVPSIGPALFKELRAVVPHSPTALRRICERCRFFHHTRMRVECRRHPPLRWERERKQADGTTYRWGESIWPEVHHSDWCGEWEELT